jgi:hypothetical protein
MKFTEFPGAILKRHGRWRPMEVALVTVALWSAAFPQTMAASTLITFDDLVAPLNSSDIPRPYHGLIFSGAPYPAIFSALDTDALIGVKNGVVSGTNVLLSSGQSSGIIPFLAEQGAVFDLVSVYFTSAVENSLQIQALGYDPQSQTTFERVFTVTNAGPTLVSFNWKNLSSLEFTGLHPDVIYFDTRFVTDDLTVDTGPSAPEPGTLLLFGTGMLLMFLGTVRRHLAAANR